jgi:hypothetical protein
VKLGLVCITERDVTLIETTVFTKHEKNLRLPYGKPVAKSAEDGRLRMEHWLNVGNVTPSRSQVDPQMFLTAPFSEAPWVRFEVLVEMAVNTAVRWDAIVYGCVEI